MNPYGPEIQAEFCFFLGEDDLNSEKGGIYESCPDRYVPNSSPATKWTLNWGAREGGRTLRRDVFLPSKHLLSAFYETLPSENPSKNLVFTENPCRRLLRTL